ncbi:MAG: hypothetical protein Q8O74_06870 [bacterium]|nr:hypothetical protein [bacterium]
MKKPGFRLVFKMVDRDRVSAKGGSALDENCRRPRFIGALTT